MSGADLSEQLVIADVLKRWPETIPVFHRYRMGCIGCTMAPFETLGEAVDTYGLPRPRFINELRTSIEQTQKTQDLH